MAMATLPHSAPTLEVTAADDDMEISSDFGGRDHDAIDIDIDVGGVSPRDQEGDYMLDDASSVGTREPQQGGHEGEKDDIMLDGDGNEDLFDDGDMQEEPFHADEHLVDASYEETGSYELGGESAATGPGDVPIPDQDVNAIHFGDSSRPDDGSQGVTTQLEDRDVGLQSFEQQSAGHQSFGETLQPNDEADQDLGAFDDNEKQFPAQVYSRRDLQEDQVARNPDFDSQPGFQAGQTALGMPKEPENATDPSSHENASPSSNVTAKQPASLNKADDEKDKQTKLSGLDQELHQNQQTSTGLTDEHSDNHDEHSGQVLHPVVVMYQESEISLFPPADGDSSETFFLHDQSVIDQSIHDLLQACRIVLDDTISEEEELELGIADLGLTISEDCVHASSTTFSEILDIYVQLQQSHDTAHKSPLYITLTTRTRFSTRLNNLLQAAQDGRSISELTFLDKAHARSSEHHNPVNESQDYDTNTSQRAEQTEHSELAHGAEGSADDQDSREHEIALYTGYDEETEFQEHDATNHQDTNEEQQDDARGSHRPLSHEPETVQREVYQEDGSGQLTECFEETEPTFDETVDQEHNESANDQFETENTSAPEEYLTQGEGEYNTDHAGLEDEEDGDLIDYGQDEDEEEESTVRGDDSHQSDPASEDHSDKRAELDDTTELGTEAANAEANQRNNTHVNGFGQSNEWNADTDADEPRPENEYTEDFFEEDSEELPAEATAELEQHEDNELVAQASTENPYASDNVIPAHNTEEQYSEFELDLTKVERPTRASMDDDPADSDQIPPQEPSADAGEVLEVYETNDDQHKGYESDSIDYDEDDVLEEGTTAAGQDSVYETPPGKRARAIEDDGATSEDVHAKRPRS